MQWNEGQRTMLADRTTPPETRRRRYPANRARMITAAVIIDGPVRPIDRVYAIDKIRDLCERAPRTVHRARARLSLAAQGTGQCPGTADAIFVLEGGLIVCAGSAATTVREAVDRLEARLRHRLLSL